MKNLFLILFLSTLHTTLFCQSSNFPPSYYLNGYNAIAQPVGLTLNTIWRNKDCKNAWDGCTPALMDVAESSFCLNCKSHFPDTIWISQGLTVSVRSIEGFNGILIISQNATLIIEDGAVSDFTCLIIDQCASPSFSRGGLTAAFTNPNGKIIVEGTLINKKQLDIYGMMHIKSTGRYIQDDYHASLNFYSFGSYPMRNYNIPNGGTQSDTLVDNSPYLKIDAIQTQFKKGKLTFNNCKLGKNASLIEFGANGQIYTDAISDLHVIINNDTILNPYSTQDGYKISGPNQRNFHVGIFELKGTAKVSMKPVNLTCAEMILNVGTEFRADGSNNLEYWTRFNVYKNVINNGTLIVDQIAWVNHPSQRYESLPYSISGTGRFRNRIIQANATASFSNLSFANFNPKGIDIRTPISVQNNSPFQNDSIKVNLISDVLYGFEPTYNPSYPNSRVVCDGTGSLLLKRTLNSTYSSTIAIGTSNFATPLKISQTGSNSADTFRIRALPVTPTLDAAQCFPVMWEIKESTAGGNFGFAAAPILYNKYFASRFTAPLMRLYEKKNSAWTQKIIPYSISNSTALKYWQFNTVATEGNFFGKDTLGVACGNGLFNESGKVCISKIGGTINWTDPNSWEDGVVPSSNQPIYIKPGTNITVNTPITVDDLNIEGSLNISPGQSLTIGENKNNAVLHNTGTLSIGSGTINVNGEFTQDGGFLTMNGGTINIDPNSGTAATSRTLINSFFGNASVFNILNAASCNISGNINFLDPISGGGNIGSYYNLASTNTNFSGINFTYGDSLTSGGTSADQFRDDLSKLRSLDNLTINTGGEANNIFLNTANSGINVKNITVKSNSVFTTASSHIIFLYGNLTSNGRFNYTTGAPSLFVAANSNFIGSGLMDISNLRFGAGCSFVQLNLNNPLTITNINFSNSTKLVLNNSNLLFSRSTNLASTASYIVTNGTGKVYDFVGSNQTRFFPIGTFNSYTPINITGATSDHTGDSIYVNVKDSVLNHGTIGAYIEQNFVNKTWDISESTFGGSNINVTAQWNASDELPGFIRTECYLSHFENNAWDIQTRTTATGNYTQTRNNITSFSPFGVSSISTASLCPGNNFAIPAGTTGTNYQWQLNTGTGFADIEDGINYIGTTKQTLSLIALPTNFYGYQYRCMVNGVASIVYDVKFSVTWYGNNSTDWFNTSNWGCSSLPNDFTDVVIPNGRVNYPIINANTSVRTLRIMPAASLNVNSGVNFSIKN